MDNFIYFHIKDDDMPDEDYIKYNYMLINADEIIDVMRSSGEDSECKILCKNGKSRFKISEVLEAITNNKNLARFFKNAGVKVELEE